MAQNEWIKTSFKEQLSLEIKFFPNIPESQIPRSEIRSMKYIDPLVLSEWKHGLSLLICSLHKRLIIILFYSFLWASFA